MIIKGQIVDVHNREIFPGQILIEEGKIQNIERISEVQEPFILPGLIDAHIHIESSMLTPGAFAGIAVTHGTVGVVSDPHEIANVLGFDGVKFMINDSKKVPLRFWFGAPSCVPATSFESSGGRISTEDIDDLFKNYDISYLSEMMNFPGVIYNDPEVLLKIAIAKKFNKPIDGHSPGLTGDRLKKYISSGISTDHECSTIEEAQEKIKLGMKILIREGSAARNLEALKDLIISNPDMIMFCSDDIHPEMLLKRHINKIIGSLVSRGFDVFDTIRAATVNPVNHYGLDSGLLRIGDAADLLIVDGLDSMNIQQTWINGNCVFKNGKTQFKYEGAKPVNKFNCNFIDMDSLVVERKTDKMRVIKAYNGELLTDEFIAETGKDRFVSTDTERDILKIIVKDRYNDNPPSVAYISGLGLKAGAFASSIAHDSHNIIAVGVNDFDILSAVNEVIRCKGGLAVSDGENIDSMELNIAGIISDKPCSDVAAGYEFLSDKVKALGCDLSAPFMTLSFMALLVIPRLKLSDQGLFDGKEFKMTSLFV